MALTVGAKAPDFTLPTKTADGPKSVKLSDHFGKQNTLLLFFPMAFTGVCTAEMCDISNGLSAYAELNTAAYGISGDNPFAQEAWAHKEKIGVPLLSDYEHQVARAYDVAYDAFLPQLNLGMAGVAKRSAFIIDKSGTIQYAESNDDARELPDFNKIKAKLTELK
ncbi:MAG: redoxin domain-containing protein [Verrucomicrobiota bacterium]|nr:redoxin domain-containing protein [Verrucomicrobiota bacterium]